MSLILNNTTSQTLTSLTYQNSGTQSLAAGIATSGIVFAPGEMPAGAMLTASIGGSQVAVQLDTKTTYADGSIRMAMLSLARPEIAAGASLDATLSRAAASPAPAALDLGSALAGHSFNVNLTSAAGTTSIDVLSALRGALALGTASFWQSGPLATQARIEVPLAGSQRLVFDVTAFANGGLEIEAQFNNDRAMEAAGGRAAYSLTATLDGRLVANETLDQGQYQNWHRGFSTDARNGGQGLGDASQGWLNIRHDMEHLEGTGAVAQYNQAVGVSPALLEAYASAAAAPGWAAPLAADGVTRFMPATGGRQDIGFTTTPNTAWLISQDIRAAEYALGQAEAAGAIPWHHWDAAHRGWLSTDQYPRLWTDQRGGTGTPGNPASTGLTQQPDALTGWSLDAAHQPDLSYVPYLLTGERWMLDNLQAQAAWNVMGQWPLTRGNADDLVVRDNQVRGAAWSLRQIDEAAWASPDGSAEKAYFTTVSAANWSWLVSQIPAWTVQQGEAHGWLPGDYGAAGALPPWQQDYFASTAIAAARHGNADAMTWLEWASNFLVGRFTHGAQGFAQHDGAAYLIAISDAATGTPYKTWAEIGVAQAARGWSNGAGWSQSQGDYPQLALATLAGLAEVTGSAAAAAAYRALLAEAPPFTATADFNRDPTFAIEPPGSAAPLVPRLVALSIVLGAEAWNGDPLAVVKVDGVQVFAGGVSASHASGGAEIQLGSFASAAHQVSVEFTNDAWGGSAATDRNLYVEALRVDGVATGQSAALLSNGTVLFDLAGPPSVAPPPPPPPPPPPGQVALAVVLGAQAFQGNPIATVLVDGQQVFRGEISASHATGGAAVPLGLFDAAVAHTVRVEFANDLWGGNLAADRNLYVEDITVDGRSTGSRAELLSNGGQSFTLPVAQQVVTPPLAPPAGDTLRVSLSQDAWQGDARFTIKLDGLVLVADGVARATHGMGVPDVIELRPSLTAGPHSLVVSFTNDAWGGSAGTDRNLYVDALSLNGVDLGQRAALFSNGDASFAFTKTAAAPPPTTDMLRIGLSADSWQGDPIFVLLVDGKQMGGERSVAASHAAGRVEFLELAVPHAPGPHELAVRFINDAWGGNALADRNLYVESVALNGVDLHQQTALFSAGDAVFAF